MRSWAMPDQVQAESSSCCFDRQFVLVGVLGSWFVPNFLITKGDPPALPGRQ
jgi:hypothetical protein